MQPYYQHGGITIYHGDCRDVLEQWEGLRTQSFDLLLTDPPYGIRAGQDVVRHGYQAKDWDDEPVTPALLARCRAVAQDAIIWGGNYFVLPRCQRFLVWDKQQPEAFTLAMCEMAWTSLDGPAKIYRQSVLSYIKEHPTEKPESLMRWCISLACADTILDPFMGAGTVLVAAKRLGRHAVGIEREERYCEIAARRLAQDVLDFTEPAQTLMQATLDVAG